MNPFDVLKSLSENKERISDINDKTYNSFIINRAFSYFSDTVFHANQMNLLPHLDSSLKYDYFYYAVKKQKRYAKWPNKEETNEIIEHIKNLYGYNQKNAEIAYSIMSPSDRDKILQFVYTGGTKK